MKIPVIGCGGISTADDVLEFLVVGCRAVQIGTASFADPGLLGRLAGEVEERLEAEGIADVNDLIGTLRAPNATAEAPRAGAVPMRQGGAAT